MAAGSLKRPMRLLDRLVWALLGLPLLGTALVASPVSPASAEPEHRLRDGHGIHVVSVRADGDRLLRVVVSTRALERPVRVNVLLPEGYAAQERRYPSLYLFHGTSGGANDWLRQGEVVRATAGRQLLTVMPDAGYDSNGGSWFTDWVDQETPLGAAKWERFHVRQLVPWIDANFRTIDDRSGRAIAGLSQGGFGAYTYAARHPDTFVAAASFSGAPDIARHPAAKVGAGVVISGTMTGLNGVQPYAPFGDPVLDDIIWQGHNPATLVTNLAHTDLRLWCGNGQPGPYDDPEAPNPGGVAIEQFTHDSTMFFTQAADAEGIDYLFHDYGPGTHTWPYWARDLRQWLPRAERVFSERRSDPAVISHRAIERTWRQWGWQVATRRDPKHAWSGLVRASHERFTLAGGRAVVTTPGDYRPGRRYRVTYVGGTGPGLVVSDERGRLRIGVRPTGDGAVRVDLTRAGGAARARTR
jgi:diacylglycerol O-acyltransferase / trehalose O-mycolyltransferase